MQYQCMDDEMAAIEEEGDIVELWRRGVLGDHRARLAYLRRTLPPRRFAALVEAEQARQPLNDALVGVAA